MASFRRGVATGGIITTVICLLLWYQVHMFIRSIPSLETHVPPVLQPHEKVLEDAVNSTETGSAKSTDENYSQESSQGSSKASSKGSPKGSSQGAKWEKPSEIRKIMGLVFYGRRQSVSILDCYLKRNLVKNGGMLDGVIFVERTKEPLDLDLLYRMLSSEPEYEKWEIEMSDDDNFSSGFGNSYDQIEDDVLYVKMDDDVVFMEDSVIPSLVQMKVEHPEYYLVSANVVNQPLLSWVHWNLGAVKSYLPEVNRNGKAVSFSLPGGSRFDWRPSSLPGWKGPDGFQLEEWEPVDDKIHRWLPVKGSSDHILDNTPIAQTEYHPYGRGWSEWHIGAQEHYSLLENLEKKSLDRYKFDTWDFQYERMGIQFMAIMGKDINEAKPIDNDDENHFSCTRTRETGRHGVASGAGVAAHYSFGSQRGGMERTDVLERYRAYAKKHICTGRMLWTPDDDETKSS